MANFLVFVDRHGHCFFGQLAESTELIEKGMVKHFMSKAPKHVPPPISDVKSDRPALQERIVHGYDSGELFREDLWLRRIEQSRRLIVVPDASMRLTTRSLGVGEEDVKRIRVMLAQYAGTRFNN